MIQVVAKKYLLEGTSDEFIETAKELVALTRQEQGCIQYDLVQDTKDLNIVSFIETWETREALQAHMETEHFLRLVPLLATFNAREGELNIYQKVL